MHSWRHRWPVELMCRFLHVSERGYRSWRSRPISRRERTDMKVLAHIREQYSLSLGSYGRPRMTMELKEAGLDVSERRVGRLMRINGIKPAHAGTRLRQTVTIALVSRPTGSTVTLPPMHPTAKWAGDITYIWTQEGWLYLAVILDLHSRRVVGWAVSDRMKKDLAIRALGNGGAAASAARGLHFPLRSRQPILLLRLSKEAAGLWPASINERQG